MTPIHIDGGDDEQGGGAAGGAGGCSSCSASNGGGGIGAGRVRNPGGVDFMMSMGRLNADDGAGAVFLRSLTPDAKLGSPTGLEYSVLDTTAVVLHNNETGSASAISQIESADTVMQTEVIDQTSWKIKVWDAGNTNLGTSNAQGYYEDATSPIAEWRFYYTVTPPALEIDKVVGGSIRAYYIFDGTVDTQDWTLTIIDPDATSGSEQEVPYQKVVTWPSANVRRTEIKHGALGSEMTDQVVEETYATFALSYGTVERITERVIDPDGLGLTTTIDYYDDTAAEPEQGQMKSVQYPDGNWVYYYYDSQTGRRTEVFKPFGDQGFVADPWGNPGSYRETRFDYDSHDSNTDTGVRKPISPRTVTRFVDGNTVSKTFYVYADNPEYGQPDIVEEAAAVETSFGSPDNLRTTTYYDVNDADKLFSVEYPDGRLDQYIYDTVAFNYNASDPIQSTVTLDANGGYTRTASFHNVVGIYEVANKTTIDFTITDKLGRVVMTETQVSNGSNPYIIDRAVNTLDSLGRVTQVNRLNGEVTHTTYSCCSKESETAPDGTVTTFEHDAIGRLISETKTAVTSSGELPGLSSVVTSYEYDGLDRRVKTTISSGGLSLGTERQFDAAGRLYKDIDAADLETEYTYSTNGRQVTEAMPGGFTTIRDTYIDGSSKSMTGTAVVSQYYAYGSESDGTQYTESKTGSSSSLRYQKSWTDFLGRQFKTQRPAYPTGTIESVTNYEGGTGLVESRTETGQPTVYYLYDSSIPWRVAKTVADIDGTTGVNLATDRVVETDDHYELDGQSVAWHVSESWVYPNPNDGTTTVKVSEAREQLTGFTGNVVALSKSIDLFGNETVTTTEVDPTTKTTTVTTDTATSNTDAVSVSRRGLVQYTEDTSGNRTTYGYDGLERRRTVTDSRDATTTTVYDASNGRVQKLQAPDGDGGVAETLFGYGATTGRRTSITNPLGNKTYIAYSDRGQVEKVWGDVPQPVKLGYNDYGERTTLTTYRGGDFTGAAWPSPEPSGDVTTWEFDGATGLLESKTDAASKAVAYTYYPEGRLKTRTWARHEAGVTEAMTTYGYDSNTALLNEIAYSATATTDVTFAYDRLGRVETVTDDAGTHTYSYNSNLQLDHEEIDGVLFDHARITRDYETTGTGTIAGRYGGFELGTNSVPNAYGTVGYRYDDNGRFWKVAGPGLTEGGAKYKYRDDSDLLDEVQHLDGSSGVLAKTVYGYENKRSLVTSVENRWENLADPIIARYEYQNDELGRRKNRINDLPGTSSDSNDRFSYNDRNELTGSVRWSGTTLQALTTKLNSFDYDYDPIGNRKTGTTSTGVPTAYTTNELNEYEVIARTGIQCYIEDSQELTASDAGAQDAFGTAQRISGDWTVVGTPKDDDNGEDAGAAYFFESNSGTWMQNAKVVASTATTGDEFGFSTAIDGDVAVIGAPKTGSTDDGAVYIYRLVSGTWTIDATLIGSSTGGQFGYAVAIDGGVVVVSAPYTDVGISTEAGEAYVYRYDDTANPPTWNLEATLQAQVKRPGGHFAMSLAIDGDNIAVGSPHDDFATRVDHILNCGSVTMFQYNGSGGWPRKQTLYADSVLSSGDHFGTDVALAGDTLVVGCPLDDIDGSNSGLAQLFTYTFGANPWYYVTTFRASDAAAGDEFGSSVALESGRVVIGSKNDDAKGSDSGSAYLFGQINGEWLELAKLAAENGQNGDHLGGGKAAFAAGLAMFGAPDRGDLSHAGAGAVHTFDVTDANGNNAPDPCDEAFSYDADGNLTQDANFNYTWDGENRLVSAEPRDESTGALRVTYTYDYMGRRVRRLVEQSDGQAWSPTVDTRYLYDGWNCVAEFDGLNGGAIRKRYTWGLDLSGTLQGAGGVGGLLACEDVGPTTETSDNVSYLYEYDANGNVMALVDSSDGEVLARYDYDPYGNLLSSSGLQAANNAYRFSTKPLDDVTGWYYYGYRYYSPGMGRWVSRDRIEEDGGVALYEFTVSNPVQFADRLGNEPINIPDDRAGQTQYHACAHSFDGTQHCSFWDVTITDHGTQTEDPIIVKLNKCNCSVKGPLTAKRTLEVGTSRTIQVGGSVEFTAEGGIKFGHKVLGEVNVKIGTKITGYGNWSWTTSKKESIELTAGPFDLAPKTCLCVYFLGETTSRSISIVGYSTNDAKGGYQDFAHAESFSLYSHEETTAYSLALENGECDGRRCNCPPAYDEYSPSDPVDPSGPR